MKKLVIIKLLSIVLLFNSCAKKEVVFIEPSYPKLEKIKKIDPLKIYFDTEEELIFFEEKVKPDIKDYIKKFRKTIYFYEDQINEYTKNTTPKKQ